MLLRYVIKQLLMPPGGLLLLLLLAWCWRRRWPRLALGCLAVGLLGLWGLSLPVVVQHAAQALETEPALLPQAWPGLKDRAQAIVVLGAGRERGDPAFGGEDQATGVALQRMRYAARLARASGLPLLTSGGLHYGSPPSEAWIMARSLQEDFNLAVRWQEGESRTTWENAVYSARLLKAEGITRVVVVTQAWHMPRARWCFEQAGLEVVSAPMGFLGVDNARPLGGWLPEGKALWQNGQLLNEMIGAVGYRVFY
ncbi:YdcF family protein [Pseudomonas typographi]|uniref:YdcF family protein n=1 Tax=Pseudomonas typographi TaxID=2715964 RepID=A0ABR7Z5Z0_9PSED|nr:YdcF family protein [Pseudomonas typographi]MBD1588982.1 YdcF family protein [Pseudomonas typographi]MBD1600955.1 YdcF family protein [Pseudomonas typographi]